MGEGEEMRTFSIAWELSNGALRQPAPKQAWGSSMCLQLPTTLNHTIGAIHSRYYLFRLGTT